MPDPGSHYSSSGSFSSLRARRYRTGWTPNGLVHIQQLYVSGRGVARWVFHNDDEHRKDCTYQGARSVATTRNQTVTSEARRIISKSFCEKEELWILDMIFNP
jgi:hypothetical protein